MPFPGTAVSPRQNAQKRFPAVPADFFGKIKSVKLLGFLSRSGSHRGSCRAIFLRSDAISLFWLNCSFQADEMSR